MRAPIFRLLPTLVLAALCAGCGARGLLYNDTIEPLDLDLADTAAQPVEGRSDWKTFNYLVQFDWQSAAIADAARAAGLTEIHYADMRIRSYLLGVWTQRTAIVYGWGPSVGERAVGSAD